jgi:hypothetical protein
MFSGTYMYTGMYMYAGMRMFMYASMFMYTLLKAEAISLHATEALGWRGIAPTHSRLRH